MKLFSKDLRVNQADYGTGTVISSDERYTVIEFDQHGRRTFVTDMVKLDRSDVPAPDRRPRERARRTARQPQR
jgi:hypothetical protein